MAFSSVPVSVQISPFYTDSLVAQMVKNPPEVWETWVGSLDWEDPLEEGMTTYSSILAWRFHGQRSLVGMGSQRVRHD